eukprot:COSAG01_NODE_558_length_15478_cov_217.596788_6_plen_68_part_00
MVIGMSAPMAVVGVGYQLHASVYVLYKLIRFWESSALYASSNENVARRCRAAFPGCDSQMIFIFILR